MQNPKTVKKLFPYFLAHKWKVMFGIAATILMASIEVLNGALLKIITNGITGISKNSAENSLLEIPIKLKIPLPFMTKKLKILKTNLKGAEEIYEGMITIIVIFLAAALLFNIFRYLREIFMNVATERILQKFKHDIYESILYFPQKFFDSRKTGDLVSHITWDVMMLNRIVSLIIEITRSTVYIIIIIPVMFLINWKFALFTSLFFPISVIFITRINRFIKKTSKSLTANVGDYTAFLEEKINMQKVVKVFNNEKKELSKFDNLIEHNFFLNKKIILLKHILKPSNDFLGMVGIGVVAYFFFRHTLGGSISEFGDIAFFLYLMKTSYKPVKKVAEALGELQIALVSTDKIFTLLEHSNSFEKKAHNETLIEVNEVLIKELTFSHSEESDLIKNLSFKAESGEIILIKGKSGSGKTTLFNLLLSLYKPSSGDILINGTSIYDLPFKKRRKLVTAISNEISLLEGTIEENLLYGNKKAEIGENHLSFLKIEREDLKNQISANSKELSTGMKQKIMITRAILRSPEILLVDEVLDTIDDESAEMFFDLISKIPVVMIVSRKEEIIKRTTNVASLNRSTN